MTIIRNDRRQREAQGASTPPEDAALEEDVDYSWHPSDEELPNPIPADRWLAMLSDPEVFDKDGLHAVECLNDYGGPVTFQQLSVKYRGTMGRYRKWLNGVAQRAATHEGRQPLGKDQFGQDEWWPYLYRQRIAGKAAANVHEMLLRPEVVEALEKRGEAASAERKRQVQQAADAERARRAEQRRARLAAAEKAEAERRAQRETERAKAAEQRAEESAGAVPGELEDRSAPVAAAQGAAPAAGNDPLTGFLQTMAALERDQRTEGAKGDAATGSGAQRPGSWRPLDYAHRYADRLADALELVSEGLPGLTVARVAREAGEESVAGLQSCLNGSSIPSFATLDRLCDLLFLNEGWLEAPDHLAADLPVFATVRERLGVEGASGLVWGDAPREVVFVMDDSPERRGGIIVRQTPLRCALLERMPVSADADRYSDPALSAYVRLVREIDARADGTTLTTRSLKVSAADWDALASGLVWPGTLLG